jgi:hypothetical protein
MGGGGEGRFAKVCLAEWTACCVDSCGYSPIIKNADGVGEAREALRRCDILFPHVHLSRPSRAAAAADIFSPP